ncbi:MAG TPA: ADP-heptose synthase [Actinobacteria bacterium]|jgi:rfaE bifunctional protein kinase chain/domain|nr:ADP-heptose synthase [Actinomycetota bacterium]
MRSELKHSTEKVLVAGKFRVIHAGHMRLFRSATELGNTLIVALDTTNLTQDEINWRRNILKNIEYVDQVIEFVGDIEATLREIRPEVVIKGQEFRNVENPESMILAEFGGRLVFTSGSNFYSESDLIGRSDSEFIEKLASIPKSFMSRNTITTDRLMEILEKFAKLSVCVVGDLIIDEYINCHPLGMSQEEPTVVVTPVDKRRFFGGAGIVAAHCTFLGAKTSFISVTGDDEAAEWAMSKAEEYGVKSSRILDGARPTTLKQRFRSGTQTLLKISHLSQDFLDQQRETEVVERFRELAPTLDVLIFSDFSYGVLSPLVVEQLQEIARSHGIFMSADSQSSSQIGNLSKFNNIDLICATEREARLELKDGSSGLVVIAEGLRSHLGTRNLLLKIGADGVLISAEDSAGNIVATDEIGALNKSAVDTSGAGDSMLAGASLALASGATIQEAALLGSILAGIQVGRLGNVPIAQDTVTAFLQL